MQDELARLDATAQAERVRRGELTPRELVEAGIARLEALNPRLNAAIHLSLERARERAASPDLPDGPFRGVPFLMKDIGGEEAGEPLHAGMRFAKQAGWRAREDSYYTRRIRAAGLVSLGRTNTPELALLPTTEPDAYGATRNPWSLEHSAGGSSGGAAAAVAAGIVPMAHASDGGGSIRGPASMCALVGLKPTRGRSSFGPGLGERWSGFSCEFAVTRSVRDAAALLDCVAGAWPGDPYAAAPPARPWREEAGADPGRLRVGVLRRAPRDIETHESCVRGVENVARALAELGHTVEESHPEALDDPAVAANYVTVVACNTARALESWGEKVGRPVAETDVEPLTWELAQRGGELPSTRLLATLEYVHRYGRRLAEWWQGGFDLLLTPTQAQPPVRLGELRSTPAEPLRALLLSAPYGVFTFPFNLSGQPAVSLPAHWTDDGRPVGAQLVAPTGREDVLLRVSAQLEQALGWRERRPPFHA